jgi:hypothetical protein
MLAGGNQRSYGRRKTLKLALICVMAFAIASMLASGAAAAASVCAPPDCVFPAKPTKITFKATGKKRGKIGKLAIKTISLPKGARAVLTVSKGRKKQRIKAKAGATVSVKKLAAGTWTVSAEPVVAGGKVFYPAIRVYKAKLNAGAKGKLTFDYSSSYVKRFRYADGASLKSLRGPDASGSFELEIADPKHIVKAGTVLAVGIGKQSPMGQMLRIKRAKAKGKLTLASATAGDLADLGKVSFDLSKDVAVPAELRADGKARRSPHALFSAPQNMGASFTCSSRTTASAEGPEVASNVRFLGPTLRLDTSMQHSVNPTFTADIDAGVRTEFQLKVVPGVGCTLDQRFGNWILPSIVVPGVPVVLTPTLQLALKGSGSFGAGFEYPASAEVSATAGFTASLTGVDTRGDVKESHSFNTPVVSGTGSLKVSAGPVVNVYANGYVKLDVSLEGFLRGTWDSAAASPWTLFGGFEAIAGLSVPYVGSFEGKVLVSKEWPLTSADTGDPNLALKNGGPHYNASRVAEGFDLGDGYFWNSYDTAATHPLRYVSCAGYYCLFTTGAFPAGSESPLIYDSQTIVRGVGTWDGPLSAGEGGVGPVQCVAPSSCYGVTSGGVLKYFNGTSWAQSSSNTSGFGSQSIDRLSCTTEVCVGAGYIGEINVYNGPYGPKKIKPATVIYDISCTSAEWCLFTGRKNLDGDLISGYWTLDSGVPSSFHPSQNIGDDFLNEPLPGRFSCASPFHCYGVMGGYLVHWDGIKWSEPAGIGNGFTLYDVHCRTDGSNFCAASNSDGYIYTNSGGEWIQGAKLNNPDDALLKLSCGGTAYCGGIQGIPTIP